MLKTIRFQRHLVIASLVLINIGMYATQRAVAANPLPQWNETEVISNDRALIELARRTNSLMPGDRIALDDPRLKNNCNQIRAAISQHQVACTALLEANNRYIYIVQIFSHVLKPPQKKCVLKNKLPKDLLDLAERIHADANHHLSDIEESQHGEYVGDDNVLTYHSESRKAQARKYHEALRGKSVFLAESVQSCDSQERAYAFMLMNYVGNIGLIKGTVFDGISDPESVVRNSALRLVSTFHGIFDGGERSKIINMACVNLRGESFFDLNKSLAVLYEFALTPNMKLQNFSRDCLLRIEYLSEISRTEQVGGYAKGIIKIFQGKSI